MKKLLVVAMTVWGSVAVAQSISNVPTRFAAYVSSDGTGNAGTWQPLTGTGGTAIQFVPQPIAIYYSTDGTGNPGTWAAWNGSSTSGGAVTMVFGRTGAVVATAGDYTAAKVTNALDLSNSGVQTLSGALQLPVGQSLNTPIIRSLDGSAVATLLAGRWTYGASSALSTPTAIYTGSPIATGGSGTTTWPMILMQPTGTTTTTWSTAGTELGINAASGFAGNLFDFQSNGTSRLSLSAGGTLNALTVNGTIYHTATNCTSGASPAVCAAAASGAVALPAGTGSTLVVNTTAVTATSRILLTIDDSLTVTGVTCNTTLATLVATPLAITARTAGSSFTVSTSAGAVITTNPLCFSYLIFN
jgi:hypothetical protein